MALDELALVAAHLLVVAEAEGELDDAMVDKRRPNSSPNAIDSRSFMRSTRGSLVWRIS